MATETLQKGNSPRSKVTAQDTKDGWAKIGKAVLGQGAAGTAATELQAAPGRREKDSTQDPTSVEYGGRRGGTSTDPDSGISFFTK